MINMIYLLKVEKDYMADIPSDWDIYYFESDSFTYENEDTAISFNEAVEKSMEYVYKKYKIDTVREAIKTVYFYNKMNDYGYYEIDVEEFEVIGRKSLNKQVIEQISE